jgi:hypothetical protein
MMTRRKTVVPMTMEMMLKLGVSGIDSMHHPLPDAAADVHCCLLQFPTLLLLLLHLHQHSHYHSPK